MKKKRIIILGGGFTGTECAKKLEKKYSTVLIDKKEYFEFTPGILRTITEPEHGKKIELKHKDYLKKTRIIIGKATRIKPEEKKVIIKKEKKEEKKEKEETIKYDYLIIATGSKYEKPIKNQEEIILPNRMKELIKKNKELKKKQKITIIGGGIVGVELAAEIKEKHPEKKVTIIQKAKELMPRTTKKAKKYAEEWLKKRGATIKYEEEVKEIKKNKIITNKGEYETELTFICAGITPNNEYLPKEWLDNRGFVKVDKTLRVKGTKNIYAGGDITNIREEKLAQTAEKHAKIIIENIKREEENKEPKEYKSKKRTIIISLGKKDGIMIIKGKKTITGRIPGILKGLVEKIEVKKRKIK